MSDRDTAFEKLIDECEAWSSDERDIAERFWRAATKAQRERDANALELRAKVIRDTDGTIERYVVAISELECEADYIRRVERKK